MVAIAPRDTRSVSFEVRGAGYEALWNRDRELVLSGPAGTGKTTAIMLKLHLAALKHPGMRALMLRKTLTSLTGAAMVTYTNAILGSGVWGVVPFGGSKLHPTAFRYPNGSEIVVGGLDKAAKVMSSEYDLIGINEVTELTEAEWEALTTRLRNGVMPYQQLIGDCNPDTPSHWLKQRANRGAATMLESRHVDNPAYWDATAGRWTEQGAEYIGVLDRLTGVRYKRLRLGLWVAAEGQVYEGWDPAVHLIDAFPIPADWPRYWAVDFGFTHPFAWQAYAMDPDGRLYRYRELYQTGRLVEDMARRIDAVTAGEPRPVAVVCDHDAEGRATLEKYLSIETVPAHKAVTEGIQAVAKRLQRAGDGRPRLFLMRDARMDRDETLASAGRPTCTEEEFPGYVWQMGNGRRTGEEPVKHDDDGVDATRYLVAHVDRIGEEESIGRVGSYLAARPEYDGRGLAGRYA